ncbi:hypothetical protein AJ79_08294 [Helicocarpus griseus UAMH5409]|uniref:Neosartoricin B biosynthesis protein A n=1 Tax=Helicocarpus griseus UAMH5409 TaxID=1447875 RepID=A0A2B7WUB4_9EURO|nr:hypothetical protein AJ79_08294 [Helicocarpus griseus UAMH5409]
MQDIPVPIAVVGMSCRLPGANTPDQLWQRLSKGDDSWSDVPEDRFKWESFYHPETESQGSYNHRGGHFLQQNIAAFDNGFFSIGGYECEAIDPQQRILLEIAYEALENAGISDFRGSSTSVYVAVFSQDYAQIQLKDIDDLPKYHMTGTGPAIISNRISYAFDLKGPSVTLDTGCSGGLVAIHQASQSLRTGECSMALAGGVSLLLSPDIMIPMSLMHILNEDGRCYSFDARGRGYGRGEGAAMVVLKRLNDAIQHGDHIHAIIRNTSLNHVGKTAGITLPSKDSQQNLIRIAYQQAGLNPLDTTYIEAHGTGTVVGDETEVAAIQEVFEGGSQALQDFPLYMGSIKPNIGHLESVSGLAGFIKAVLMIERGKIPPNLNLGTLKKTLGLGLSRVTIPTCLKEWPEGRPRRISVNSFGYRGTNGHAIVESLVNQHDSISTPQILTLTANNQRSLREMMQRVRDWAACQPDARADEMFINLAYTLTARRSIMQWRNAFSSTSLQDTILSLSETTKMKPVHASSHNCIVFVFTGQGAQWFSMGRELMKIISPYADSIDRSEKFLTSFGASWSLTQELLKDEHNSRVNEREIAQPVTTAVQIALVDLLMHLGVKPYAVLGHSSGEIGAAYAAGALEQAAALKVSYSRGLLNVNHAISMKGAMLAANLEEKEALTYISKLKTGVAVIACLNSPTSVTLSGDEEGIDELRKMLDYDGIWARRLMVDTAYHSHHVEAVAPQYLAALQDLKCGTPGSSVRFYSSVKIGLMTGGFGAEYWVENLISKVRFHDALVCLCCDLTSSQSSTLLSPTPVFVEIGPHNSLAGPIRQTMSCVRQSSGYASFSTLRRHRNALSTVFDLFAKLFEQGCPVDVLSANLLIRPLQTRNVIHNLPPYAWDHSNKHWHESHLSRMHRFRQHPHHDLLGVRMASSTSLEPVWRHIIGVKSLPWLLEHTVDGVPVFPAAAYMSMAIEAIRKTVLEQPKSPPILKYILKEIFFVNALYIPVSSKEPIEIQLRIRSAANSHNNIASSWKEFCIISVSPDGADVIEHCRGLIMAEIDSSTADWQFAAQESDVAATHVSRLEKLQGTCITEIDCVQLYDELKSGGNYYGPTFACVKKLLLDDDVSALGTVVIPDVAECMPSKFFQPHVIHPTTLDSLLHAAIPLYGKQHSGGSLMPVSIGELSASTKLANAPGTQLTAITTVQHDKLRSAEIEVSAFQADGNGKPECVIHITKAELLPTKRVKDQGLE